MKLQNDNDEFWHQHHESMTLSGSSRSVYCRQHGLNYDRFGYWLRKQKPQNENKLISVRLKSEPVTTSLKSLCTLELKNGHCLKIHDPQVLTIILDRYA